MTPISLSLYPASSGPLSSVLSVLLPTILFLWFHYMIYNCLRSTDISSLNLNSSSVASSSNIDPNAPPIRVRNSNVNSRKPYPCDFALCKRSYLTALNLQKHQQHHPKNFPCRYTPCVGKYVSAANRTTHEVTAHGKSEHYTCYLCAYASDIRSHMRAHILRRHEEIPVESALRIVIDGIDPKEELGEDSRAVTAQLISDKSRHYYVCDICNYFSTEKRANVYQHVWRQHRGVSMKDVMARIDAAKDALDEE